MTPGSRTNLFKNGTVIEIKRDEMASLIEFENGNAKGPYDKLGSKLIEKFFGEYDTGFDVWKKKHCYLRNNRIELRLECIKHTECLLISEAYIDVVPDKDIQFRMHKGVLCICDILYINKLQISSATKKSLIAENEAAMVRTRINSTLNSSYSSLAAALPPINPSNVRVNTGAIQKTTQPRKNKDRNLDSFITPILPPENPQKKRTNQDNIPDETARKIRRLENQFTETTGIMMQDIEYLKENDKKFADELSEIKRQFQQNFRAPREIPKVPPRYFTNPGGQNIRNNRCSTPTNTLVVPTQTMEVSSIVRVAVTGDGIIGGVLDGAVGDVEMDGLDTQNDEVFLENNLNIASPIDPINQMNVDAALPNQMDTEEVQNQNPPEIVVQEALDQARNEEINTLRNQQKENNELLKQIFDQVMVVSHQMDKLKEIVPKNP